MTDNVDAADALNVQIDDAKASGDMELANTLYQRQMGVGDDGIAVPGVGDSGADDQTVTVSGEMDFASNPESVTQALELMSWWDRDENGVVTDDRVTQLKAEWGSDMGANLAYFEAFALAHPDIDEIITESGFGDHPVIVKIGAILGRRYATVAGDPGQITTQKGETPMADNITTEDIEAGIKVLQGDIEKAKARGEYVLANDLYQDQLWLEGELPGGSEPVIGRAGRNV